MLLMSVWFHRVKCILLFYLEAFPKTYELVFQAVHVSVCIRHAVYSNTMYVELFVNAILKGSFLGMLDAHGCPTSIILLRGFTWVSKIERNLYYKMIPLVMTSLSTRLNSVVTLALASAIEPLTTSNRLPLPL